MQTIHDIKADQAKQLIADLIAFIRSHDASYSKNLEQVYRACEVIDNLNRYANAVQDKFEV